MILTAQWSSINYKHKYIVTVFFHLTDEREEERDALADNAAVPRCALDKADQRRSASAQSPSPGLGEKYLSNLPFSSR